MLREVYPDRANCRPSASLGVTTTGSACQRDFSTASLSSRCGPQTLFAGSGCASTGKAQPCRKTCSWVARAGRAKPFRKTGRRSRKRESNRTRKHRALSPSQRAPDSRGEPFQGEWNFTKSTDQDPPAPFPCHRRRTSSPHRARGRWKAGRKRGRQPWRSPASPSGSCHRIAL